MDSTYGTNVSTTVADVLHQIEYNLKQNPIEDDNVRNKLLSIVDSIENTVSNYEIERNALVKLSQLTCNKIANSELTNTYHELEQSSNEDYENCLKEETDAYKKNKVKPMKSEFSKARTAIKKKPSARDEEDDDIVEEEQIVRMKDPITKKRITDPVRNKICLHVYQHDSIIALINDARSRRTLNQCPTPGCTNKKQLNEIDIEPYPDFFKTCALSR